MAFIAVLLILAMLVFLVYLLMMRGHNLIVNELRGPNNHRPHY